MDKKKLGFAGEDLACRYLERNGYQIVERNKSYPRICEIDIIAKKKNKYYFVEVKTRKTDAFGIPSEAVDARKSVLRGADQHCQHIVDVRVHVNVVARDQQ